MEFLEKDLEAFVEHYTKPEAGVLAELNRETYAKVLMPRMLSGHIQGKILEMFSHMIRPDRVLEIGTFTGYSAICLASGMREGGVLHTIDVNEELEDMVKTYVKKAGMEDRIRLHIGTAAEVIPTLKETFDLVFIDADKENYSNYYDLVFDKVRKGGFIIADNVLWSGKVVDPLELQDDETMALVAYSRKVTQDPRVENVLMPVRDGLMVARKLI
ncbi:MAG: class I SAM-dependent methyltransferase [Flavobacteriales bacterium]|nr:class I SAM-dependent methyltransferase [Flavobacteriales bacterium]MCB9448481.1 class I SAM-dependent methyltransferase [Flavobacteriales bacterium]